ncbi:MAG: DNA/RNA non-specific endonuclease [Actinomycetota bacterium]
MAVQFHEEDDDVDLDQLRSLRERAGLNTEQHSAFPPLIDDARADEPRLDAPALDRFPASLSFEERKIGSWDLVEVAYLRRGIAAARAVCKLHARDQHGPFTGTGFLVSPRLLATNAHNLPTEGVAAEAYVDFDYEYGINLRPPSPKSFRLTPDEAFWVDADLDVCLVAVESINADGEALEQFGHLRLDPNVPKIEPGQFITLIHHPNGEHKQVSLRENRLLEKLDNVLRYASDTGSGSSGAPCFSDRWQVVAIHKSGVPEKDPNDPSRIRLRNGTSLTRDEVNELRIPESEVIWVANEGVRISRMVESARSSASGNALISQWLEGLRHPTMALRAEPVSEPPSASVGDFIENRRPINNYEARNGYRSDFLAISVPPPSLDGAVERWGRTSYNSDTGEAEFPYYNFTVWMSRHRRMAFVAAVNIDGASHNERLRDEFGKDKWVFDDRLPERLQIGEELYGSEPARYNKNYFDRGHLVRRTEPSWGTLESARLANDDTFHFTNCTPQYKDFNQRARHWQGLEMYLLERGAVAKDLRMTLMTGPIFSDDDTLHRGVLIPSRFFKVALWVDDGTLRSAAYVLDQSEWVDIIDFERAAALDVRAARKPVAFVEHETGIGFGDLVRAADAADGLDDADVAQLPDLFDT